MKIIYTIALTIMMTFLLSAYCSDANAEFENTQTFDDAVRSRAVWDNKTLAARLSDVGQTVTVAAPFAYAIWKGGDRKWHQVGVAAGITLLNNAMTGLTKVIVGRERPNKKNHKSFFSGHTSSAFAGAGLLCSMVKGKKLPWCLSAFGVAAATGYLRIAADKHWASDVLVGAGVGVINGTLMPSLIVKF